MRSSSALLASALFLIPCNSVLFAAALPRIDLPAVLIKSQLLRRRAVPFQNVVELVPWQKRTEAAFLAMEMKMRFRPVIRNKAIPAQRGNQIFQDPWSINHTRRSPGLPQRKPGAINRIIRTA